MFFEVWKILYLFLVTSKSHARSNGWTAETGLYICSYLFGTLEEKIS